MPIDLAKQAAQDLANVGNAVPAWESELRGQINMISTVRRMANAAGATGVLPSALKRLEERALYYHDALDDLVRAMEGTD